MTAEAAAEESEQTRGGQDGGRSGPAGQQGIQANDNDNEKKDEQPRPPGFLPGQAGQGILEHDQEEEKEQKTNIPELGNGD